MVGRRQERQLDAEKLQIRLGEMAGYLWIADKVTDALELLSQRLFKELLGVVEQKTTIALQEILEQPIRLRSDADFKRGTATVDFWIDHEGYREDVYRGQGGSVANILSVSLRLFALTTLSPAQHRPFLVLDEQHCWLRPDLVPKLVKIVRDAGRALGFQVIMISHHDLSVFQVRHVGLEGTLYSKEFPLNETILVSSAAKASVALLESVVADADLVVIVEAWPSLPSAIRAGIIAMIRATKPTAVI